ncbi:hypothetical protein QBC35DRAFT_469883 [Podospora australis]|uniref:Uncharacterized protein n=1 Tax=Podospora australis TaxID=1536484 RepID=A0AAN7AMH7_9PEZI|nr:hypothetical protein QBC35DRAFT_469883 [Podospora australis]
MAEQKLRKCNLSVTYGVGFLYWDMVRFPLLLWLIMVTGPAVNMSGRIHMSGMAHRIFQLPENSGTWLQDVCHGSPRPGHLEFWPMAVFPRTRSVKNGCIQVTRGA